MPLKPFALNKVHVVWCKMMSEMENKLFVDTSYKIKTIFLDRESTISSHVHIGNTKPFNKVL